VVAGSVLTVERLVESGSSGDLGGIGGGQRVGGIGGGVRAAAGGGADCRA
jgi:hypothetical protein